MGLLNSLDPQDMSRLAGYCALMMVLCHYYEGYWPDDDRYRFMKHWLKEAKHRTTTRTQTRLAAVADEVARTFYKERREELQELIESKDERLSERLMEACRREMDERGITRPESSTS